MLTLTGITVIDPKCTCAGGDALVTRMLIRSCRRARPGCTACNHTVTQAELDAGGNLTNTVTADSIERPPTTDTLNIPVTKPPVIPPVIPPLVVTPRADLSVTKAASAAG